MDDAIILSGLILFTCGLSNAITLTSSSDTASVGVDFTFSCISNAKVIQLVKDGVVQYTIAGAYPNGTCSFFGDYNKNYKYRCNNSTGVYNLTIPSSFDIDTLHGSKWQCSAPNIPASSVEVIQLYVYVPITQVTITSTQTDKNTTEISLLNNRNFNCQTNTGRPASMIQWYISGKNITDLASPQPDTNSSDGKFISSSELTYTGIKSDNGKVIYCTAVNGKGQTVRSENKSIVIWYSPNDNPSIQQIPPGGIVRGNEVKLICTVTGGNPLAVLTWDCDGTISNETTGNIASYGVIFVTNKTSNHEICTCYASHLVPSYRPSINHELIVYYEPIYYPIVNQTPPGYILSGTNVTLTCEILGGNPLAILSWNCTGVSRNNTSDNKASYSVEIVVNRTFNNIICQCSATHYISSFRPTVRHQLDVYYSPNDNPSIQQIPPGGIVRGNEVKLICTVTGGNPLAILTWDCDGTISNETTGNIASYGVMFVTNKTYNHKICTCYASHLVPSYRPSINHELIVYYEPIYYPITNQTPPGHIISGTNVILTCEILGGNPLAILSWNCTGVLRNNTSDNKASYSVEIVVNRTFNNRLCQCSATHYIPSFRPTVRHQLDVYFKPVLDNTRPYSPSNISATENTILQIILAIHANPKPTIQWTFKAETDCRFSSIVSNTSTYGFLTWSFISIDKVQRHDFGEYAFTANNTVGIFFRRFVVSEEASSKQETCSKKQEITGIFVVGIVTLVVGLLSLSASVILIARYSFKNKTIKSSKSDDYTGVQRDNSAFTDEYTTIESEIESRPHQEQSSNTYEECERKTEANPYRNVKAMGSEPKHHQEHGIIAYEECGRNFETHDYDTLDK